MAEEQQRKSESRISKSETHENDQIEKFEFRICFGFRYLDFEFLKRIWNG